MIKRIIAGILLFSGSLYLFADPALLSFDDMTAFLTRGQKNTLLEEGELTEFHFGDFSGKLLPPVPMREKIESVAEEGNLNLGIEGLFLFKDFDSEAFRKDPEGQMLDLYNHLRAIRTLEGTRYYSASRGEMRDLFVESWRIPDLEKTRTKMDDPLVKSIPAFDSFLIHQKDKSFGKHESRMDYTYDSSVIWTSIINQSPMFYKGFLKVINPEKMQIHLLVMPTDKGLLFYGITAADTLSIKAFREKANNSFYNRVVALYQWYTGKL